VNPLATIDLRRMRCPPFVKHTLNGKEIAKRDMDDFNFFATHSVHAAENHVKLFVCDRFFIIPNVTTSGHATYSINTLY